MPRPDRRPPRRVSSARVHTPVTPRSAQVLVAAVVAVAAVLLVAGLVAIWADDLLLSPSNWESTSAKLLDSPAVRTGAATYLVNTLDARLAALTNSDLPIGLPVVHLVTAAARPAAIREVEGLLTRPQVRALWEAANLAAAESAVGVVNGNGAAGSSGGVTIDLDPILRVVAGRLGLPSALTAQLPARAARLTVVRSSRRLSAMRTAGRTIRTLARWLVVAAAVLLLLALVLARGRRRAALAMIGAAVALSGAVVLIARSVLAAPVAGALTASPSLRATITAIIAICTQPLAHLAVAVAAGGLAVAAAGGCAAVMVRRRRGAAWAG